MLKVSIKLRVKPPKRRSPLQKLKSRLYYRRNRAKIRLQRRKYMRKYRTLLKNRKLYKRYKPTWLRKKKPTTSPKPIKTVKPKLYKPPKTKTFKPHKVKKFKIVIPKIKIRKFA